MNNYSIILFLSIFLSSQSNAGIIKFEKNSVLSKESENVDLFHDDQSGFFISHNNEIKPIAPCWIDAKLQNKSNDQLNAFQAVGYIKVTQMSDDEFKLDSHTRGVGGGPIGATIGCIGGKMLVHAAAQVAYTAIAAGVGLVCPPAAPIVFSTLEYTFFGPVEAVSNAAAIAGGIALAVATGPV